MRTFLLSFAILMLSMAQSYAQGPIVLENFTMSACGDFYTVDANLKSVLADQGEDVIALNCHVTYGDKNVAFNNFEKAGPYFPVYKKGLSRAFCDERHRAYLMARVIKRTAAPQIVVNGRYETLGMREDVIESVLRVTKTKNKVRALSLSVRDGVLALDLPAMQVGRDVDVWLFGYNKAQVLSDDADVVLNNHVTHLAKLLTWNGEARQMSVPLQDIDADGVAVVIQRADGTDVIGAGRVEF